MIWGSTPQKVLDRVNAIIDELGQYELRIRAYEEEARLSSRLMPGAFGPATEVAEWRMAHDDIYEVLVDIRAGIKAGTISHEGVAKDLGKLKKAVRNFKRVLDQTDALTAAGRRAAKKALGIRS